MNLGLFRRVFLNLNVGGFSRCLSVIGFWFDSTVVENILYYLSYFKLVELYFMAQDMVYLGDWSMCAWGKHISRFCWVERSIYVSWALSVGCVARSFRFSVWQLYELLRVACEASPV